MRDGGAGVTHSLSLHKKFRSKTNSCFRRSMQLVKMAYPYNLSVGSAIFKMQGAEGCDKCVRAYFVQLERLSSFIQIKWIKHALAHSFELHFRDNLYSTSGGIWRLYIPS